MKKFILVLCVIMLIPCQAAFAAKAQPDNVHLSGALVAEPCTLPDSDTDIHLDFGTVIESYLYEYRKTLSKPFFIHLIDCDPSLYNTLSVTFQGPPDSEDPGILALDPTSTAKGVAIGFALQDGSPLSVNKPAPYQTIAQGNNTLAFSAFVQAEPSAVLNKTLVVGDFKAIATFILSYQ